MDAVLIAERLRSSFGYPLLALRDGKMHAVKLGEHLHIELCLVHEAQTLCIAAPLGTLSASQRPDCLMRLMLANLYLADAGQPHYAMGPHDDTVFLCRSFDPQDLDVVEAEVTRLVGMAGEVQAAMRAEQLVC